MAGTEPVDDSFLDEVDDSFLDEVDEPTGEVNRIDLNAPEPSAADELRRYGVTPQNAGRLRDALALIGVPGFKVGSGTGKALALGAIRGGTAEAAPMISRNTVDRDFRKQATKPYEDAERDSPIATFGGQALAGAPLGMLLSRGGFGASVLGSAAMGGLQGFLGSKSGADSTDLVDEFSGANLAGKGIDAAKGIGVGAGVGALGYGASKGIGKLLQMFGPKTGAAVASGADDVATRADDFLSQMDDAAPDSVADDVIEPLKPVPEAGPPRNRSFGDTMGDDVTLGAGDEIFARGEPGAATKKLGIKKPDPSTDTGAMKMIDDELDAMGKGGDGPKPFRRNKEAWDKIVEASGVDDFNQSRQAGHFDEIERILGRKVRDAKDAFDGLVKMSALKRGRNQQPYHWDDVQTAIRELKQIEGLENLQVPSEIQEAMLPKDPAFLRGSEELAEMLGQGPKQSKQEIAAMTGADGKRLPYGNKYAKGPLSPAEQADFDAIQADPRAAMKKLADELRGPKAPAVEAPPPPAAAVEPPGKPKDPKDWYDTFFPQRAPAQRAPMGKAEPIDIGDDFGAMLEAEVAGPQRARVPSTPRAPIDLPDMPQKIPEPISDDLFAAEAAKVNALGGQKFATAPPVMPASPRPRPAPIEAPGFDASRASLVPPPAQPQAMPKPAGVLDKFAGKAGRHLGRGVGAMVGGKIGSIAGPVGTYGGVSLGGHIGEKIGERLAGKLSPEQAAQALAADPAKLQQLASGNGPMSGAARFILQGMEEAGEAGLRARAFVAASMPSLRELFAPSGDRTTEQDR